MPCELPFTQIHDRVSLHNSNKIHISLFLCSGPLVLNGDNIVRGLPQSVLWTYRDHHLPRCKLNGNPLPSCTLWCSLYNEIHSFKTTISATSLAKDISKSHMKFYRLTCEKICPSGIRECILLHIRVWVVTGQ